MAFGVGVLLYALRGADIDSVDHWLPQGTGGARALHCDDFTDTMPTGSGDWAMRVIYKIGNISAGQSKTVKYEYGRM